MKIAQFVTSIAAVACGVMLLRCGSSQRNSGFDDPSAAPDGGEAGVSVFGEAGGPDAASKVCSADLQKVLDPSGVVVATCPPDQGCASGACVPACMAAAASKGSLGCNYVVATPSFDITQNMSILPPCFAVFLANGWGKPAQITAQYNGNAYDVTKFARVPTAGQPESAWPTLTAAGLPAGGVAVLFLSSDPASANGTPLTCPVAPAINAATAIRGTGRGKAWRISSDVPVTAYDILPYGGAKSYLPSAELLFPVTSWGTNYVTVVPPVSYRNNGPFWGQITAGEDNTKVELLPSVNLPAGSGVVAAPKNTKTSYTLMAGEYVQFQTGEDLSGSIIASDKPVSFTGGNGYMCYQSATSSGGGCDGGHQFIPPVTSLGSEYVAAPYKSRRTSGAAESISYRLLGIVAGTTLTYDPPVAGAPTSLDVGVAPIFETPLAFRVKSQDAKHPFYVAQIMSGSGVTGGGGSLGDEEYVNLPPPAQFLKKYVFFTDPSYPTTTLSLTRTKTSSGFMDVNIACLGNVTGWTDVGSDGRFQTANVDLVRGGTGVSTCKNGAQTASSDGSFGIMVWGLSTDASYAYPAGGNAAPINEVIVPAVPK